MRSEVCFDSAAAAAFSPRSRGSARRSCYASRVDDVAPPRHIDLERDKGLSIEWSDGSTSFYPVAHLRRLSPSAEARTLREQLARNPLTVMPARRDSGPLRALEVEVVGRYALRIRFSDGHDTGIYTWRYLREIDPARAGGAIGTTDAAKGTP
jgi:DUF971 family protein